MSESLANITQIFNQSPQVSSLVGGHQAAVEAGARQDQISKAREYEQELQKKVLAAEKSQKGDKVSINEENKRERKKFKKDRQFKKVAKTVPVEKNNEISDEGIKPVIDVCV